MPNDLIPPSPDIADADDNDDVVDLLKIVKPGKTISPNGAALKKEDDFSADLEAMLGQIAEEEETRKTAEPPSPFPDPTPVDHAVDPDETLNMPSMDDLDNLLATLGAETGPQAPVSPSPKIPAQAHSLPDLDALPLAAQQPQAAPNAPLDLDFGPPPARPAQPAPPPAQGRQDASAAPQAREDPLPEILLQEPESPPEEENARAPDLPAIESLFAENIPPPQPDLPDMEALFGRDIPKKSTPDKSPAETDAPARTEKPPLPEAPPSPETGAPAQAETAPAAAPEAPPSPETGAPAQAETAPAAAPEAPPSPETGAPSDKAASPAVPRYDEVDLNELDAVLEDMLASAPPPGHPPAPESRENSARPENGAPSSSGLAPLQQALNRVKDDLADLKKELRERNDQIEKQQSRLAEQAALVEDLRAALTSLRDNMDKEAALSAARVIREELASLLKDGPPAS